MYIDTNLSLGGRYKIEICIISNYCEEGRNTVGEEIFFFHEYAKHAYSYILAPIQTFSNRIPLNPGCLLRYDLSMSTVWMLYTAVHRILDKAVIDFSARNPFTVVEPTWANISKVQTISNYSRYCLYTRV